jgi:hypothetical protein
MLVAISTIGFNFDTGCTVYQNFPFEQEKNREHVFSQ